MFLFVASFISFVVFKVKVTLIFRLFKGSKLYRHFSRSSLTLTDLLYVPFPSFLPDSPPARGPTGDGLTFPCKERTCLPLSWNPLVPTIFSSGWPESKQVPQSQKSRCVSYQVSSVQTSFVRQSHSPFSLFGKSTFRIGSKGQLYLHTLINQVLLTWVIHYSLESFFFLLFLFFYYTTTIFLRYSFYTYSGHFR